MKFIITIDTEGDNQWDHGRILTVENIKFIGRFQDLCEKYNIKPTYLVTSEICNDEYSHVLFSGYVKNDRAEIGAHLHSWTTPPFLTDPGYTENDSNHSFASELPYPLLSKKIAFLTEQITSSFGVRPTSFRSGRYGFNEQVAKVLSDNNYMVDSSVTPFVSWVEHRGLPQGAGGPDFLDFSPFPYSYDFSGKSLAEIPVTIVPTKFPLNRSHGLARFYFRNVNDSYFLKVLRRIWFADQPVWLRPTPEMTLRLLLKLVDESERLTLPFITMMFHSSELMPGCSKYRPDEHSIEVLYSLLEDFFIVLTERGIKSVTLTDAAKDMKS